MPYFESKSREFFEVCLKYLAILSRKFLRAKAEEIRNEIDHKVVSAAIDLGIWHDEYGLK
jgi:hypothetical protein